MCLRVFFFLMMNFLSMLLIAQSITQNIKGQIVDEASQVPIAFAEISILNSNPLKGTITDETGHFVLGEIAIGRYDIKISFLGYEPVIINEVLLTASKEVFLHVGLRENTIQLGEVVVKPRIQKSKSLNKMAAVSARMLSVEEANRYAGGFDDPARLAASFAGVASGVGNNAIIIRGNAPKFLQWKMEGVEITSPNHFANLSELGGGGLTALSSNLIANSDFLTGAFPAEYNNALAGVFDLRMRKGNDSKFEHSFEAGLIGIDAASEGPLNKAKTASYLINYRYSTLGLISSLLPEDAQGTNYQDLSFKLNFRTKKAGVFSFWGIGLIDNSGAISDEKLEKQTYYQDIETQKVKQYMGASGINHRLILKKSAYLNTTIAFSSDGIDLKTNRLNALNAFEEENKIKNASYFLTLKSFINKKFSNQHSNRTGFRIRGMGYDLSMQEARGVPKRLEDIVLENGFSTLLSAFSNSTFNFSKLTLNLGLNAQLFTLNNNYSIEPRLGLSYLLNAQHNLSFGYGLHSALEPLNIYFAKAVNTADQSINRSLDFSKAHHFVLSYNWQINDKLHLKLEPYYQALFNLPIIPNSNYALLNLQNDWFINDTYINEGKGKNYGIDLTFEQFVSKGFYYLVSGSVFDSKYKTNGKDWYNTRYNKGFLFNALVGKEFQMGKNKQNLLGLNFKLSYQGGNRHSLIDVAQTSRLEEVVYDETIPFTEQVDPSLFFHFTATYEWHSTKTSQRISLKILNAGNEKEFLGHRYNILTKQAEVYKEALIVPNLSYRISF